MGKKKRRRRKRAVLTDADRIARVLAALSYQDKLGAIIERRRQELLDAMGAVSVNEAGTPAPEDATLWERRELNALNATRQTPLLRLPLSSYEASRLAKYLPPAEDEPEVEK